jgi:hypothetical protein
MHKLHSAAACRVQFLHDRRDWGRYPQGRVIGQRDGRKFRHAVLMEWPSGIFNRSDAIRRYGDGQVQVWLRTGAWRRVARGIYASADTTFTPMQRVNIASQSAGRDLAVVGRSAALLHGFGVLDQDVVHLAGTPTRTARTWDGLQIHGHKIPPADLMRIGEMIVTTPDRTIVDLARNEDGSTDSR